MSSETPCHESAVRPVEVIISIIHGLAVQISEGHRRNAITYTSLICAAEKSGQWQLALELFHRVTADSVAPNAAIFNAAMSACAQGTRLVQSLSS